MKRLVFISMLGILILLGCHKDSSNESQIDSIKESQIDSISDVSPIEFNEAPGITINTDSIYLSNGQLYIDYVNEVGIQEFGTLKMMGSDPYENLPANDVKTRILSKFKQKGDFLINRSNFHIVDEGIDRPAQSGLAYVYGGKDFSVRWKPHSSSVCKQYLYGLDCSGFVYQLFTNAKLFGFPQGNANDQIKLLALKNALSAYRSTSALIVKDLGRVEKSNLESGDLIGWNKLQGTEYATYQHIGVVLKHADGRIVIYQSNGSPDYNCSKNIGKGPRIIELSDNYFLSQTSSWTVLRMYAVDNNNDEITSNQLHIYNTLPLNGCPSGCTLLMSAKGGKLPYKYSLNGITWQTSNKFTVSSTPKAFVVKDANNFVDYCFFK